MKKIAHSEESSHGGDKPWVYFMIDCFFLVTQFFVITFKVKADEALLPQKLPPGVPITRGGSKIGDKPTLRVHVASANGVASYGFLTRKVDLAGLSDMLADSVQNSQQYQVRISYDADVPFEDVMAVFNTCSKVKIAECGLVPLRVAGL